jgi:mannose-6-phosphate isomerase-like protein (cupin superfamily)
MRTNRRHMLVRTLGMGTGIMCIKTRGLALVQTPASPHQQTGPVDAPMFVPLPDVKWSRIPLIPGRPAPGPTDPWPEIAILRVAPETKATQLMIRVPKNFHVPPHWHTANETHTIVKGTFIMECEGRRAELGPGSFNYMPSKMVHQAWTKPEEETLLFITVDGAWDVNFVNA